MLHHVTSLRLVGSCRVHDICLCRAQAALSYLVLNANQLEDCRHHPGSIAMAGDFNNQIVFPPPPASLPSLHNLLRTLRIRAVKSRDTHSDLSQGSLPAHVKTTLQELCNQIQANQTKIFEGHSLLPLLSANVPCLAFGTVSLV